MVKRSSRREKTTRRATFVSAPSGERMRLRLSKREWVVDATHPVLTFGRAADNDIVVENECVSRRHGSVQYRNGKVFVADASTNGTYVVRRGARVLYLHDEAAIVDGKGTLELGNRGIGAIGYAVDVLDADGRAWQPPEPIETQPAEGDGARYVFRRQGDYWTVAFGGPILHLKDSKGLRFIAYLLAHPDREFHVVDLALGGINAPPSSLNAGAALSQGLTISHETGGLPALDRKAKVAYKRRIAELRGELAEAERLNDIGQAARAREELEVLSDQLVADVGLGGRDRQAGSAAERARVMVTVRVKSAIGKLHKCDPSLGHHLATSIRTGRLCSYHPDPHKPLPWAL